MKIVLPCLNQSNIFCLTFQDPECFVPSIPNGFMRNQGSSVQVNQILTPQHGYTYYQCNEGCTRTGIHYNRCGTDGNWEEIHPTCDCDVQSKYCNTFVGGSVVPCYVKK